MSPQVTVVRTKNQGAGAATNVGVAAVETPFLTMLDSDDLWKPTKIEEQFAVLKDTQADVQAVLCRLTPFGEVTQKTADEKTSGWSRSTLLIETEVFRRVGPVVDMENGFGEMIDWFSRAKSTGVKFHMVDEPLALRRIHSGSTSFKADQGRAEDMLRIAHRAIMNRRKCGE